MSLARSFAAAAESIAPVYGNVPALLAPLHPYAPVGALDIFGAARLSMGINWVASDTKGRSRATFLQEALGMLVIVFGGETFLALCTGTPPGWLVNPTFIFLFAGVHFALTRTPLRVLVPAKPNLLMELVFAPLDAIGRTLLLTRFSIIPLLHPPAGTTVLPATPSTLVLVPFILAVPFAALVFSGTNWFAPQMELSTPNELKPGGWMAVDAWIAIVVPVLFLSLIGPVEGWPFGLGMQLSEDAAIVVCAVVAIVSFVGRTVYNLGGVEPVKKSSKKKAKKA
ncbi:uncharacterized protein CcaverHIS019_0502070 [Cutaneotrichosporon cavernicola]|uniref:Uncharacterized protein n=1 Tax=Cutaneotrichosporon cavernicola TaxID=279322 RepID=A0AA48QWK7_9TREE|nr:uncharacterized protein CcaverHIS019_0502070 [Cutaneotrichosporon cavernicola]BEI92579.1 hypothetical protein CcaverHIS019_0502070 [Cutaneotrichosporon cavernicola]BEJ00353.1 hypothetical protein CcaverHIS631_0502100 [Cutaneotrichosporon cavernicola]BEJ08123.1 hypothetical protein CcaverHIS641_0502080 [Cutaneotrichosporon cavernicola]